MSDQEPGPFPLARWILWGFVAGIIGTILLVAVLPGPPPPPFYEHLRVLHDSALKSESQGPIVAHLPDGEVTATRLVTPGGSVTVHRTELAPPRPGTALALSGGPPASFYFELDELVFVVDPRAGDSLVVSGYLPTPALREVLKQARDGD